LKTALTAAEKVGSLMIAKTRRVPDFFDYAIAAGKISDGKCNKEHLPLKE
jgi:hypothetical protein